MAGPGHPPIVTLTTDFGTADTFVGQMKGAALSVDPTLQLIDVTHRIPPHDIRAGAYALSSAIAAFPDGTVHVAVVDPGVGTSRRGLVVQTERYLLVGPDNGVLSWAMPAAGASASFELSEPRFRRSSVSPTFHGRDVFAPAAAWLCRGTPAQEFGPAVTDPVLLPESPSLEPGRRTTARVLWIDRFGNVALDLETPAGLRQLRVATPAGEVDTLHRTYGEADFDRPFAVVNSDGRIELALREASAAAALGLSVGDRVEVVGVI